MQEFLELGQIVNTYGIKGYVKIVAFTDDVTRFDDLKSVFIEKKDKLEEYFFEDVKYHQKFVLIKFMEVKNIDDAEKLKGYYIKIDKKDCIKLPKDSYFIADMIGLNVYTTENNYLGKLEDVFNNGNNDIYVVKNDLGKQILLPAIKDIIKDINIEDKKITVQVIEGLLNEY